MLRLPRKIYLSKKKNRHPIGADTCILCPFTCHKSMTLQKYAFFSYLQIFFKLSSNQLVSYSLGPLLMLCDCDIDRLSNINNDIPEQQVNRTGCVLKCVMLVL